MVGVVDQLVKVLEPRVGILIFKITTHCQHDVVLLRKLISKLDKLLSTVYNHQIKNDTFTKNIKSDDQLYKDDSSRRY